MEKQIHNYLKILETSPDNVPAFKALAKIYQDHERWGELANLYVAKAQRTSNKDQIPDLLFMAAEIYAERLAKYDRVEDCYMMILETDPLNVRALEALKKRYRESHQWDQLIHLLEREAEHRPEAGQKADCCTEIAALWSGELNNEEKQVAYLIKAQEAAPDHLPSLRQLKAYYLKTFQVDRAIALVEREEALLTKDADKADLYLEVGLQLAEDPFERERAIHYLERASQSNKKKKTAKDKIKELIELDRNWEALTRKYQEEAIQVSDKRDASAIYLKIAGILFLYSPQNQETILSTIEKSLILDSSNRRALLLGERYLSDHGLWEKLAEFYRDIYERTRDEALKVEAMGKAAVLLHEKLGRAGDSLALSRKVIELNPDHVGAFNRVREDMEGRGAWDELAALLNDRLQRCHEVSAKIDTYVQLARLAVERENSPEKAMQHLEKVLELAPGHLDASRRLVELYEQARQWDKLLSVYPAVLAAADPAARLALERRLADLLKNQVGRPKEAFAHYAAAFALDPQDAEIFRLLEELAIELECWEDLVGLLKRIVDAKDRPANWRELKFKLGQIYDKELSQYDQAEVCYRGLLDEQVNLETLDALARLYAKDLRWDNLVEVLALKAKTTRDPEERREVLLERARIFETEVGDKPRAIEAFNEVLAVAPSDLDALRSLAELFESAGQWRELVATLERELDVITSIPEKINLNFKRGAIFGAKLNDKESAARAFLAVLEFDKGHLAAIGNLEDYLNEGILPDEIFKGLEDYYRRLERWEKLAQGYEALLKVETDEAAKGALYHKQAEVFLLHRSLPAEAFAYAARGLQTPYHNAEFLKLSLEAARKIGKQAELLSLLDDKAAKTKKPQEKARLALSLGRLYWEGMQDLEQAERHYAAAAEAAPEAAEVLEQTAAFFRGTEAWQKFVVYADRLAAAAEPERAKAVLFEMTEVFSGKLDRNDEARSRLRTILAADPADMQAIDRLLVLLEADGVWDDVALTLVDKLDRTADPVERTALKLRLAGVLEKHLEDYEEAARLYGDILAEDPRHAEAFAHMERFLNDGRAEKRAADTLRPIYEDRREFDKLIQVLTVQHRFAEGDAAYQLAVRIASLYEEEIGDRASTLEWYGKAFLAGSGIGLLKELQLAAAAARDYARLVGFGDEKLGQSLPTGERVELLFALADVQRHQLADADGARSRCLAVLAAQADNETAIDTLIELARGREDYPELARFLEEKLRVAGEKSARRQAALEIAELRFRRLGQPDEAVALLLELMEERENDPQVFEQLETIYRETARWTELHELLLRKLKYLREDAEILPVKIQIGAILEQRIGDLEKAMEVYMELIANYWSYPAVGELVDRLLMQETTQLAVANEMDQKYIKVQDWQRLVQVYEIQIRHAKAPNEKTALLIKLSAVYQERLQDPQKAFDGFSRLFIEDPKNQSALEELEKLAGELGAWRELAEVYEKAGEGSPEAEEAIGLFVKAARLYEDILAFQDDAIRAFRKVLDRDRNNITAVQALEGLCRKTERWEDLRDIYLQRIELTDDGLEKKELFTNICILYEHQLEDPLGAAPYYEAILELTPDDLEVIDKLLELNARLERWANLAELYSMKLALVDSFIEKHNLMLEKADLHETRLADPVTAKDLYKTVLDADPGSTHALARLEHYVEDGTFQAELARFLAPFYREREDWHRLIDMEEYQFNHSEVGDERLELLIDVAAVYENALRQQPLAFSVHTRAFRERPTHAFVQAELERLAGQLGKFDELVKLYEELIEQFAPERDAETMVGLLLNLANLYETYLQQVEEAASRYRRVLRLHPNHAEALGHLERIYSLQKKWPELIDVLNRKLSITEDVERQKAILFQAANIYEDELGKNTEAIAVYHRMLDIDARDSDVLRALVRLTTNEQQWDELVAVRRMQLDIAADDDERWSLRHQIGMVLWRKLNRTDEAIGVFKGVLDENHAHSLAREAMEGLQAEPASELAAARILEPLYAEESRWDELIHALDIQAAHAEAGGERRDLCLRMAELAEARLSDFKRAFGFTVRAFAADAFNPAIRSQLERLAPAADAWVDLALAYRRRAEAVTEAREQVDLYLNAGRVILRQIDDPEEAEADYRAARQRDPQNAAALDALEEIFDRSGKWTELVDVLFTKAQLASEVPAKVALYSRTAEIREQRMGDKPGAVDSHLKALSVDHVHVPSLVELDRLYGELEDWPSLKSILTRRVAQAANLDERLELKYRMGQVVEEKLADRSGAAAVYREILDEHDEHPDAILALEHMVVVDRQLQATALDILAPLYERKRWWDQLGDLYESQLSTLADAGERIAVLARIKDIYEQQLSDLPRAFHVACRLFQEDYHNLPARQEMERLAVATGGFEGLVQTYLSFFDQMSDPALKVEIQMKVARVYEEQLQNDVQAIAHYGKVLELEPKNFTAILALDRLYERMERFSDLVALIPREFEIYDDPKELVELRLRLGRLWEEKLSDHLTAIEVYRQVTDEHPDNAEALSALERLYEAGGFWEELIEVYKAEVRIARGDTKKARLYTKMAQVLYDKLSRAKEAIPLWNRVLQFDEQNTAVLEKLEELYEAEAMWDDLVNHHKRRLRIARGPEERALITRKMGRLYLDRLQQEDMATQFFLKVLEYTPGDLETIDTLEAIYLKNQSWRELAELLKRLIPQVSGADLRSLYLRLASILVERLGDAKEGERLASLALAMEPTQAELARLEQLFRATQSYGIYLEVLERQSQIAEEEPARIALFFRMADIWREKLGKVDKARHCLERILAIRANHLQAAEALEPIYRDAGMHRELIAMLSIRLSEASAAAEQAAFNRQIAAIHEEKLGDAAAALDALLPVFRFDPSDEALLAHLEDLADRTGRHLDVVRSVRDALPQVDDNPKLKRALLFKVAQLYEDKAQNRDLAAEYFKMFLEAGEYNEHAADFLIAYYEAVQEWRELVAVYQLKLPYMAPEEKVVVGCRVAYIFDAHMGETDRAVKTYRQVLKMDDANMEAIHALIGIFQRTGRFEELVDQLRHELHIVSDPERISAIRLRIAQTYQDKIGDLSQAKTYYRAIIADNPKHHEALDALERIYEAEENYDELLEVLSRRVNVADEDAQKIALYNKMADIWERKFDQRDMAISYMEKILAIDPSNIPAIVNLERIYRTAADWPQLAATYQRHIDQTIDSDEIVRLFTEMGRIYGEYLFQPVKAIEYFNKALKIDENNIAVMLALSELYIANEKWGEAIKILRQIADASQEKAQRVEALARLGNIYLDHLGDAEKAKSVFDQMIGIDPAFVPALRALRRYYAVVKQWKQFLKTVAKEKKHVVEPDQKAELLYAEGRYYHEEEHDADRALGLYREALGLVDNYPPVLKILGEMYFEKQAWDEARPVLERLLQSVAQLDEATQASVHYRLAFIAEREDNDTEALKHYTAAYKIDSNNLPTLEGLARTLYRRGDWDRAFRVYQTILVRFRDQKSVPELVEIFCRLGDVNGQLGKDDVAVRMYEKALELDPRSVRALKAIVFFYESLANWKKVLQYRGRLIKLVAGDELFDQWVAVGDVYSEKLGNVEKGLEAYRHALEINTQNVQLLCKVADLLLATGHYDDAIGVLRSAVSIEKENERLIELNVKLGDLVRQHGKNPADCLDYYNAALDVDSYRMDIFQAIEQFLAERQDWDLLDGSYRLMIARIPQDEKGRRLAMWKKLGMLLAERSTNLEDSIKVWEVVAQLQPDDLASKERLADLYAKSPQHREKAVQMHRELLVDAPERVNSYRALWKIAYEAEEFDKAFCYGAVVHLAGEKEAPAAEFYRENLQDVKAEAINTLDRQLWGTLLLHRDARHNVGQILTILFHHVQELMPSDLRKENLKRKDRLDLDEHIGFCLTTSYILKTLGLPAPEIYMKKGFGPGIQVLAVQPAAVQIGADAFENFPRRELTFLVAKSMVLARPDFMMALMLPEEQVRGLLDAATQLFDANFKSTAAGVDVAGLKKRIDRAVPRKVREPLAGFVSEYAQMAGQFDIGKWRQALLLSACRAGLLMSNDLSTAVTTLNAHRAGLTDEQVKAIISDMTAFGVSDSYFHMRNFLGFSLV
ncbi:MAG: hypothetical protein C4523_14755 [Myxococcales bacterium]|nr:MAG: hypothetical protein C4523_14755 [Myxococcales bacterium]